MSKQEIKPCKFANGACIHCQATEKNDCEGWVCSPKRPWVGLTDEEIFHADPRIGTSDSNVNPYQILINARAIEAKLKERNT